MDILIVDDKSENRYLLETLLKGNGYEVFSAVNGEETFKKLRAESVDLIVSDILMPVMDGFQLCRECKSDESLQQIPFVFYKATPIRTKRTRPLPLTSGPICLFESPLKRPKRSTTARSH